MSEQQRNPSVNVFEKAVADKNYELACTELLSILGKIDSNFGEIHHIDIDFPNQINEMHFEKIKHFCTRVATAATILFEDPRLTLSESGALRFMVLQRWLGLIFAASPYINGDHVLRSYNVNPDKSDLDNIHLPSNEDAFRKFCVFYFPESNVNINLDTLWNVSNVITTSLCFALQSPRFIGTAEAFGKRGAILKWFPAKLATLKNLDRIPSNIAHDVYMHCSYDIDADKHRVKESLNKVIRRHLLAGGWQDRDVQKIGFVDGKPVMLVLLEHFHSAHSIYRTHSTSLRAARDRFYLVGLGSSAVDQKGREVFDDFFEVQGDSISQKMEFIRNMCDKYQPSVFYMPSIGMDLITIFASNTRLAPIQVIALGHPATTHSDFIEYVIVEDDYVGSEECFSETLLRLPKDALPYVPSALAPTKVEYRLRENPEVVHIGIASTTMKLNPYFLRACQAIRNRAKVKVHFHFAMGQSSGVTHPYVERFLKFYLGDDVTAHPHVPYDKYLGILYNCDMMINPFPFGNTNGIIDMVTLGLVGVCKTGPEVHEHIDEGLFKRLGLPAWLVARTVDDYVERAIRLAENHEERLALRRHIIENNGLKTLFTGDPTKMGKVLLKKVQALDAYKKSVEKPKKATRKSSSETTKPAATAKKAPVKKTSAKKTTDKKG